MAGQDSVNIFKTFPTTTLGEQLSKGPRYQETKGVEGASARQKTLTKTSKDPSRVVNTPKGGEDRYTYNELMDTIANINVDVMSQGKEIKELQQVILSQQVQISNLKKLVMKLVLKKNKSKFVLKKRSTNHDSFKKGDTKEDESQFEGEMGKEAEMGTKAESSKAAETFKVAAEIGLAAVTEVAVETVKAAAETGLTVEEIEIVETLVKAKTDTPKATQKAKGVEIKEGGFEKKRKEISDAEVKRKGKEKVVEPLKKTKKSVQVALDEEVAKQLQAEIEVEEESQTAKIGKLL
ncbi:hypothetical protein L6452_19766 [Arctium lappa]|uniref:Uncharacterized protein n=1 Tax=Arctium lappa TaxID=4217 RepID=A0ACB9B9G9_ARCLA|nr:hypothetical protein L6452_19766 [Arctium lappa]